MKSKWFLCKTIFLEKNDQNRLSGSIYAGNGVLASVLESMLKKKKGWKMFFLSHSRALSLKKYNNEKIELDRIHVTCHHIQGNFSLWSTEFWF